MAAAAHNIAPLTLAEEIGLLMKHGYSSADLSLMTKDQVKDAIDRLRMRQSAAPPLVLRDPNEFGAPVIETADALTEWMRIPAKPPAKIVYFVGDLARFNYESGPRLVRLQKLADKYDSRPMAEAWEMADIMKRRELASTVAFFAQKGMLFLTQKRLEFGKWVYFAKKDGSR